jgi:hypothetical protein
MILTPELQEEIINKLTKRIESKKTELKCPICNTLDFDLAKGFSTRSMSLEYKKLQLGKNVIPSISLVCTNCGYILDFSLKTLDFVGKFDEIFKKEQEELEKEEKNDEKRKN